MTPGDITVTVNGGEPVPGEWGEVQHAPGLEERVAALEERLLYPLVSVEPWTDEQVRDFENEIQRHLGGDFRHQVRLLPPAPVLTPETARALLRECVTVVSPGETLIIRVPEGWTPQQAEYYQEYASAVAPFPVLVVLGAGLGVVRPDDGITSDCQA